MKTLYQKFGMGVVVFSLTQLAGQGFGSSAGAASEARRETPKADNLSTDGRPDRRNPSGLPELPAFRDDLPPLSHVSNAEEGIPPAPQKGSTTQNAVGTPAEEQSATQG
jgi:hypothetical protein